MLDGFRTRIANMVSPKANIRPTGNGRIQATDDFGAYFYSPSAAGGLPPRLGTSQLLAAYSQMPWLRAITNKIGLGVGSTNWMLYVAQNQRTQRAIQDKKAQRGGKEYRDERCKQRRRKGELREIDDHPMLDLLHHGNDRLSGKLVFQLTQIHLDLTGEAYWLIERDNLGMPVQIWPLPADWVRELPTYEDPNYMIQIGRLHMDVPLTEIIAFVDPDPQDPYARGTGTARALGDELETDEYAAKHLKSFFHNDAKPPIIVSGEGLSRADTQRLEERWLQKHQGFWNKFKPHFINRKIDVKELGQTFENMQMTEIRKMERDTVLQVFGVPPEKFGILSASNRSTITAADYFWTKDILMPRIEMIRTTLQNRLVPMFDERLILDFESPVGQDREHKLNVMQAAPWAFSKNEWRREADLEEMGDDGETFLMQAGTTLVEEDGTPVVGFESSTSSGNGMSDGEDSNQQEDTDAGTQANAAPDPDAIAKRVWERLHSH